MSPYLTALLSQPVVVGIAVMGGVASVVALILRARGSVRRESIDRLNRLAYWLMGISVVLFMASGLTRS